METGFQIQHNGNFSRYSILSKHKLFSCWLPASIILSSLLISTVVNAQVTPDGSTSTTVDADGNNFTINQGDRSGNNLFHSFGDFSVPTNGSAFFNNATDITNILSRVTGGNISNIDGLIRANGTANLFLINPAGIIFGNNARLDVGGSFLGSTADSILFPDGEFSATDLNAPVLTINAPIGLGFRDNPGDITSSSLDLNDFIGLEVPDEQTIGLIGGDVLVEGGFISTPGGRIELGSVGGNSTVSLTEVAKGWDVGYEGVENFGNIELSGAAFVNTFGANTGDIEVQGGNIRLIEGSQIGIDTEAGQAGNLTMIASESLSLDGNAIEIDLGNFQTLLFNNVSDEATGEGSRINLNTPQLTLNKGAVIRAGVSSQSPGVDIVVNADDIVVETPFVSSESGIVRPGIFASVREDGSGKGGNITIETDTLTLNEGGQITTNTFGGGNAGDLTVNASESIELTGTISPDSNDPSALSANVEQRATATGNGGNLTISTPQLIVRDGAQIATVARNQGNGGTLTIDAQSVLLTGTATLADFQGGGRSGIFVSSQPSFETESGEIIPTLGNGGTLNLTTDKLTIEQGAIISINTFSVGDGGNGNIDVNKLILREGGEISAGSLIEADSIDPEADRGNGGTLNINATESVEITGIGSISGEPVQSSLFTLAESTGNAGDLTLTTNNLTVSEGGEINASATGTGSAGNLTITANSLDLNSGTLTAATAAGTGGNIKLDIDDNITLSNNSLISAAATGTGAAGNLTITANSLDLNQGTLTAATAAGTGGNIQLEIDDNITLSNNSLISAEATGFANGGNIDIDTTFIIASPMGNSDIIASAGQEGTGGSITIDAESVFGIQEGPRNDLTNDLDASGGVDGEVIINTPDVDITSGLVEVPQNIVTPEQTTAQACKSDRQFVVNNYILRS